MASIFTQRKGSWIKELSQKDFNESEFVKIITFFLFLSPCKNLSVRSKTLMEYGWETPWRKPYHLNKQLRQKASNYELIFSANGYEKMSDALEKADLKDDFPKNISKERICIYDNEHNQFMSVFWHIRNSLAHGRFQIIRENGKCVFVMEDVQARRNVEEVKVTARIILLKSTLLRWIELIEGGQKEYEQIQNNVEGSGQIADWVQ